MRITEVFRARAFRLALGFCLAISLATAAAFAFIYLQVSRADIERVGAILVDEAAKSEGDSEAQLRKALELRLTRDIRRLDFVALIDPQGRLVFGNVPVMFPIPIDAQAHVVQEDLLPDPRGDKDPAIFVARRRTDGGVLLLGRSLRDAYDLQETLLRALAIALLPTILLILSIGAWFAHRASQRFKRVHGAIVRIMNGDLDLRLPVDGDDDIDKIARAVNLMLDEIARLLERLKSAGDNIAHDLRTPLAVARAKIERALDSGADTEGLRAGMEAALAQIEKVSTAISAILRISVVENRGHKTQFKEFDLAAVCAQLLDFYEPLAESKGGLTMLPLPLPLPLPLHFLSRGFILFYFILFYFLFYFILFYFILFYKFLFYFVLFYFILFFVFVFLFFFFFFFFFFFGNVLATVLFYFILFYFILFYFILFLFFLFFFFFF